MENASKALIIAGAILLAILLIALGMYIYTQAKDAMSNTGIDSQKVSSFNQQFTAYEGSVSGAQARALVDLVINNNNTAADATTQITINGSNPDSTTKASYSVGSTYTVEISGYQTDGATKGYIKNINIS